MEFKDTIELMNSTDYKDRFKAEYIQTKIRYERLHKMIIKHEVDALNFVPCCSIDILKRQEKAMADYLYILEMRAVIEKIEL